MNVRAFEIDVWVIVDFIDQQPEVELSESIAITRANVREKLTGKRQQVLPAKATIRIQRDTQ